MKMYSFVLIFGFIVTICVADRYSSQYDNVNVDDVLANDRVLTNYIKCLMDEGPCTKEGRELKKTLPGALSTGCIKCNVNQKETAEKIVHHLMKKRSRDWARLSNKYDPKGEFKKRYEASQKNTTKVL